MRAGHRFFCGLILSLVLISVSCLFAKEDLIFAVTLIRHGDRTPTGKIKSSPHKWKIGVGELTSLGMNQHFKLGTKLRKRYVNQLKLLPVKYINNEMYVRCTDFNRTIQSAESLLNGLYPLGLGPLLRNGDPAMPAAVQPIPLRTMPVVQDDLLLAKDAHIDKFNEMCEKYVYTDKAWIDKQNELKPNFKKWSEIFGSEINNLVDLMSIADNINVRLRNGVSLPEGLSKKDASKLIKLAEWAQAQQFKPKVIGDYLGSKFLVQLKDDMMKAVQDKQQYKYILYSGHDSSILPVMSALGVPLDFNPPYASNVCFELYKDGDNYFVKVRFNGKDVDLISGQKQCSIDDFSKIVQKSKDGAK